MMKELLEIYFGKHYQSPKSASVISDIKKGVFSLSDPKACADCKKYTHGKEVDCDRIVLCLNADVHEVEVIQFEKFVDNYANLKAIPNGKKCDLLLVGNEKIVFCDMTCSKAKYIDPYVMQDGTQKTGKRDTVKKQIVSNGKIITSYIFLINSFRFHSSCWIFLCCSSVTMPALLLRLYSKISQQSKQNRPKLLFHHY